MVDKKKQGRSNKNKGSRVEREIVQLHRDNNIEAKRVPLSGAVEGYKGDIIITLPDKTLVAEVKARKQGQGFTTIERWLGDNDLLFLKRNNAKSLVVLPYETYMYLIRQLYVPLFEDGPDEEDGPWAEGFEERTGRRE